MDTNRDSAHQSQNEDNFPTFFLGLEFLNEAEKEKNNGKGDSASAPSRFMITANSHFWYCCLFFASDLMHNSTGYIIKQLVHAFSCALSSYGARGKFEEHERSVRVARGNSQEASLGQEVSNSQQTRVALGYYLGQLLRFFRALQTSHVLHNSIVHTKAWTNC